MAAVVRFRQFTNSCECVQSTTSSSNVVMSCKKVNYGFQVLNIIFLKPQVLLSVYHMTILLPKFVEVKPGLLKLFDQK